MPRGAPPAAPPNRGPRGTQKLVRTIGTDEAAADARRAGEAADARAADEAAADEAADEIKILTSRK